MSPDLGSLALLTWAAMTAGPLGVALARRAGRAPSAGSRDLGGVRVHLVRPCAGDEPELARTLRGLPEASGARTVVSFCVERRADPAWPAIEAAVASLAARGVEARIVVSGALGPNRKVQQIAAALRDAEDDAEESFVVVADSDADLEGFPLHELVVPMLDDARVGAVWAPPHEAGEARTTGDLASAAVLGASLHAFALLAELDPRGLVGKTFAARRSTLLSSARFAELERYLGEDMELSRRIHEAGAIVRSTSTGVRSLAAGRSVERVVERFGRWLAVIRAQRPALLVSYPLMFFPLTTIALAALALATPLAGLAVGLALAVRLATAFAARRLNAGDASPRALLRDVVLSELVLVAAWARALSARRFAWRDRWLRLGRDGRLVAAE